MKLLFDLFPLLVFFAAFKLYDIFIATAAAMLATVLQVGWHWHKHRRFELTHIITLVLIMVFGGLTIILQDDVFIKWKPTLVNWLFAGVIMGMLFLNARSGKKTALEFIMGKQLSLPPLVWKKLNWAWAVFFLLLGGLNIYFAFYFLPQAAPQVRTEAWVNFKVFGLLGLIFLFIVLQMLYLARYLVDDTRD